MSDFIFDDGSIAAKVLQQEIPNAQVVKVNSKKLEDWLNFISETGITKVYLHYCYEDYTPGLRAEIHTALRNNPNLRIICQYENNPRSDIEKKAVTIQIPSNDFIKEREMTKTVDVEKVLEDNKHKITNINYSRYTVGGNDSLRSQKVTRNEDLDKNDNFIARREQDIDDKPTVDPFTKKYNEFLEKRRRKKK